MTGKYNLIRTIYLYLFSLVGLFILTFGSIGLVKIALKAWVFPEADQIYYPKTLRPLALTDPQREEEMVKRLETCQKAESLNKEDRQLLKEWLAQYEQEQERIGEEIKQDQSRSRQRQAADSLAMIIVGLPLFLYHWRLIQKDVRRKTD